MKVHGREIRFMRTVWGNCEIAERCPDKDINRFDELMKGDYITSQKAAAGFMAVMSEGYEMHRAYEEPGYEKRPLTQAEAMLLDDETFAALFAEAVSAFAADGKATVEAEAPKGKNAPAPVEEKSG